MATTEDVLRRETKALLFDLCGTVVDMKPDLILANFAGLAATLAPRGQA